MLSLRSKNQNGGRNTSRFPLKKTWLVAAALSSIAIFSAHAVLAAISLSTTVPYTQPFSLGIPINDSAITVLPADFRIDTVATPRTVGSFSTAITQTARAGGAGMNNNSVSGTYSFGAGTTALGNTDRAIGFLAAGGSVVSGNLYTELTNSTGNNLGGLQISYDVEKYRKGSNSFGFRIQMFYSSDGVNWTNAGPDFLTAFAADADNSGFITAPGATVSITNKTISTSIPNNTKIYLAWNYSVSNGISTINAQALGIDNISVLAINPTTNPSGVGTANPSPVMPTGTTLLTVAVTPASNPTSTAHTVSANLTSIGGNATQTFFDDGSNGDVTAGDNVFSFNATVANGTTGGVKSLPFTITETAPSNRIGSGSIPLTVSTSTSPTGSGQANPNSVLPGENSVLTVTVTPGANPTSTGMAVRADLSSIGGSGLQTFFDDGVSGGDAVAGDNVFTYTTTVDPSTTPGAKLLPFAILDAQGRSGNGSIALTVQQPPPPADHLVISQLYGGGGISGAAFTNDYVELYNPTGNSFNLAGWSLQYTSATETNWTNKQPLGGIVGPGEYFLVKLGSSGPNGSPLPQSNIDGDINMSATTGKLALVSNSINLTGSCPNGLNPAIVDFVGYGSSASCFEGSTPAPAPSAVNAIFRKFNGAQDTNQNGTDFQTSGANPRRTAPVTELGPWVTGTEPSLNGTNAPYDSTISIDFSEPVDVTGNWYDITCSASGQHNDATVAGYNNFKGYHITPNTSFQFGEQCTVTIFHNNVHDQDLDDSIPNTDTLFADYSWTFTVVSENQLPLLYPSSVHLTMGNPSNAVADGQNFNNFLMEKPTYSLSYNRDKGTPNWVSWHLESDWFGSLAQVDTFRADPALPSDWYRVQSTDYFSTGFDRGHMTPNTDRDNESRIPINQETYLMTNMVPQAPDNNQGPWANMENDLRTLVGTQNEMYIVSGPLGVGGTGSNGSANTIANGHITVPQFTWKVVLVLPKGDDDLSRVNAATQTIAVLIPNTQGIRNNDWHMYLTTVDNIEALTGYDFFSNVPDAIENAIEAGTNGNNPPGTENQFASTSEDTPGSISINAVSALTNPTFTSQILSSPSHGVLSGSGLNLTYTPNQDYHGPDSFTFKVNDGSHDSNTSTFTLTVTEVNDAPTATDDSALTDEDTPLNLSAADLTANDSTGPADESLQTLSVTNVAATAATHGLVSINNGIVTYTPDSNYHGAASFTYLVCDNGTTNGAPDSRCASATVNISVTSVNDNPVAFDDSATTNEDTAVTVDVVANDTDVDGDARTLQSVGTAAHGSVTIVGGQAQYSPVADFHGTDSFTYVVSDGHGGTATGTVNITVNSVNDNPVAVDDSATTNEDTAVTVDVVANDTDVDGDARTLQSVGTAAHGSVTVVGGQAHYSPAADFNGNDSFTYVVSDGHGGTATGTVNITVNSVNDLPTASSQSASTNSNTPVAIGLTASDVETAPANLNYVITTGPSHGSLSGSGANRTYTPAPNYSGSDSFKFTVTDTGDGVSPPLTSTNATVSITVNDTLKPTVNAPANINVGTGAGATTCGVFVSDGTLGTASANDNSGTVSIERTGVPAGNIFPVGTTTITYIATDGAGNTTQTTQTVTVVDNTPPTVTTPAPVTVSADSNGQGTVPNFTSGLSAQDNCGAVSITQSPLAGTVVGAGTYTVTISAMDQAGNTSTATTTYTVQANNGSLTFSLDVSPAQVKRGKSVKLRASYSNDTGTTQTVTFTIRYTSPCGNLTVGNIGPIQVKKSGQGQVTLPLLIPDGACVGLYTLTLESYVDGSMVETTTATLNVIH